MDNKKISYEEISKKYVALSKFINESRVSRQKKLTELNRIHSDKDTEILQLLSED